MVRWIQKRQPLSAFIALMVLASIGISSRVVFSRPRAVPASLLTQASESNSEKVSVGGVMRDQRDTRKIRKSQIEENRAGKDLQEEAKKQYNAIPKQAALELTTHPSVAKVHEAMKSGNPLCLHLEVLMQRDGVSFRLLTAGTEFGVGNQNARRGLAKLHILLETQLTVRLAVAAVSVLRPFSFHQYTAQ